MLVMDRLVTRVAVDPRTGCCVWQGARSGGYPHIRVDGKTCKAYRVASPDGLVLDHLCRNRACIYPRHLEPVTAVENTMRGDTLPARNVAKTRCPNGHPYDRVRLASDGRRHRYCSICKLAYMRRYYAAKRSARLAVAS